MDSHKKNTISMECEGSEDQRRGEEDRNARNTASMYLERGRPHSAPPFPTNNAVLDLTWDEEEARSKKKKKCDSMHDVSPKAERQGSILLAVKIRSLIKKIDAEVRVISEVAKERNTKREIKDAAMKLRSFLSEITTNEAQELLQTLGKVGDSRNEKKVEIPTREELLARLAEVEEKSTFLKERNADLEREVSFLKEGKGCVLEGMLGNKDSYEDFAELERLEWPDKIYKSAFPVVGTPLTWKKNTDHLVIYEEGKSRKGSEGMKKAFEDRFPELREAEEGVGVVKVCTRIVTREGEEEVNERWLIRSEAGGDDRVWFESLTRAKQILVKGNRQKVAVYTPGSDPDGQKTRKMLEFIFRTTGIKCLLFTRADQKARREDDAKTRTKRSEALIISQEGKTYSDLLRAVREKVKPDSIAAQAVRTIRESRDGKKMVIVLNEKGGTATEQLRNEIRKLEAVKLKDGGKDEEVIFIQDVEVELYRRCDKGCV